jgi:hypothetical protein
MKRKPDGVIDKNWLIANAGSGSEALTLAEHRAELVSRVFPVSTFVAPLRASVGAIIENLAAWQD